MDSKGVFSDGFSGLQTKLDEKYYTSVQTFSEDMSAVFSSVIGFATLTNVGDADHQLSGVAHSSLTAEQKEIKKLAKRIIKAIQPYFEDALRKESDLGGKPYERELPDLEALLDQRLRRQVEAATIDGPIEATEIAHQEGAEGLQPEDIIDNEHEAAVEEKCKERNHVHLAPTPEDNSSDHHLGLQDEAGDEAAIAAQLGQDALHVSTDGVYRDAMDVDHKGSEVQIPDGSATAPLTPPRSEKDLLAPFAHGGIPWYMEPFEPVGTTIHDEKWTGRDVLRDMSEELSELDDDELNGLADPDDVLPAETGVSEAHQRAVRRQKKRSRGYR